jgi:hypothetical protein
MKKTLLVVCLVLLVSWPAFGSGFKFQIGPAFTNLGTRGISYAPLEKKAMLQIAGGPGFEISLTSKLALEIDLMYNPGGAKFEYSTPSGLVTFTYKGYGISLPLLLKVSFLPGTTPYLLVGGALGYTTSQKTEVKYPGQPIEEVDATSFVNRFQGGLTFGGGVEISRGAMAFLVEGRYTIGLSNLLKDPLPGQNATIQNIFILFGYKF